MDLTLFHYWRSSSSWRVRWALEHKGRSYKPVPVSLLDGENEREPHLSRNPTGYVPALDVNGKFLVESLAIIEWLEEIYPSPTLYPGNPLDRAHVRALAEIINAGTQPLTNLSVLETLSDDQEKRKQWVQDFSSRGLGAFEKMISNSAGKFSVGDQLTIADLCLIPQCYSALRFELDIKQFKRVSKIYETCLQLPSCQASHPEKFKPEA